ncbi:IclR family transcriptional regulator [Microbacteriaceae bacterium K1510]|nr:IclR family transcriptional regulator [Microbacteriaceae bacterium K1510]
MPSRDAAPPVLTPESKPDAAARRKYGNTSMLKCFEILEVLGAHAGPQSLATIRAATGLNKTTAFRLLQVLKDMGYVDRTDDGYELGYRLYRLTLNMSGPAAIRRLARPYLARLASDVGETVHLGILEHTQVTVIDKVDTARSLRIQSDRGQRLDAHATALGKVMLAYRSPEAVRQLFAGMTLQAFTNRTVTDIPQFQRLLKQIRTQGFAVDNEELELGLRCIAAPISCNGHVTCAVSISGPTVRITDTALPQLIAELRRCTKAIEDSLITARRTAD